jgi:Flp pilus assembly protein TadD
MKPAGGVSRRLLLNVILLIAVLLSACSPKATRREIDEVPGAFTYQADHSAYPELAQQASEQLRTNDFRAAETAFRELIVLEPGSVDGYIGLGTSLLLQNRFVGAQQAYNQALEVKPDSAEALIGLGSVQYQVGDYERAIEFYRSALALEETNPDALWGLAISQAPLGEVDSAIANLEKIIELVPGTGLARNAADLLSTLEEE